LGLLDLIPDRDIQDADLNWSACDDLFERINKTQLPNPLAAAFIDGEDESGHENDDDDATEDSAVRDRHAKKQRAEEELEKVTALSDSAPPPAESQYSWNPTRQPSLNQQENLIETELEEDEFEKLAKEMELNDDEDEFEKLAKEMELNDDEDEFEKLAKEMELDDKEDEFEKLAKEMELDHKEDEFKKLAKEMDLDDIEDEFEDDFQGSEPNTTQRYATTTTQSSLMPLKVGYLGFSGGGFNESIAHANPPQNSAPFTDEELLDLFTPED
jgi:hypothetical protein